MNIWTVRFKTLYRVSSQIDVLKHVQAKGLDSLRRSSSRSLKICKDRKVTPKGKWDQLKIKIDTNK